MTQSNTTESLFNPMTLDVNAMEKTIERLKEMRARQREAEARRWRVIHLYGMEIRSYQMPVLNATV